MPIDRRVPIPAYYQLKQLLKEQIQQGQLKPGDQVPTEAELCERYQLSRTPVRQALLELTAEGLLVRTPGRGTFVSLPAPAVQPHTALRVIISDDRWRGLLEQAAALWNKLNPDAPLTLEITPLGLRDIRAALSAAVGRGEAPDISFLDSVWVAEFASRHYLHALADMAADQGGFDAAAYFPSLLAANCYDGALYGMPITADVSLLWYRRDWFAAEGLAPPATWDDLLHVGRHFRHPDVRARYGIGPHPIALVGGRAGRETTTYHTLPFVWAAGGDLIVNGVVTLDSRATRGALAFLTALAQDEQLVSPEVVSYSWDQAATVFAQGQVALAVGGAYESFLIRERAGWDEAEFLEHVGFVAIPAGPGGKPATIAGGNSFVIYRQSQAFEQARALLELINTDAVLRPFGARTTHYSPLASAVQSLVDSGDGFLAQAAPLLRIARARPALSEYSRVSAEFQQLVEDCMTGRRGVDQAVPRTAELIAAITGLPLAPSAGE
jgi:ABC-type glycerol-3-phosphate transport system substrate-binding protein